MNKNRFVIPIVIILCFITIGVVMFTRKKDRKIYNNYKSEPTLSSFDAKVFKLNNAIQFSIWQHPNKVQSELKIQSQNALKSSFSEIMKYNPKDLLYNYFEVRFDEDPSIDENGVTREWIEKVMDEIFDPETGYFEYNNLENGGGGLPVSSTSKKEDFDILYYEFLGRMIARMIISKAVADVRLDNIVWKHILEIPCTQKDFEEADPVYYKNLMTQIEDPSLLIDLETTFSEDGVDFIENGSTIFVDKENVKQYLEEYLKYKYITKIEKQCNLIKKGLFEVLDKSLFKEFGAEDLQRLICGQNNISVSEWQIFTGYDGYNIYDRVIQWFWEFVISLSEKEKRSLLHFVTGSSKLPVGGFKTIARNMQKHRYGFVIVSLDNGSDSHLPASHTCFNILELPRYSSKKILEERLRYVMENVNQGFGAV